ncbi:MAG: potassium channel family protein [Fimbriimonadales bacterium]
MGIAIAILGILVILLVFADIFATIIEPRTVERPFSLTAIYYRLSWKATRVIAKTVRAMPGRREGLLSKFGPASLIGLLILWAALLISGFAAVLYGFEIPLSDAQETSFGSYLYVCAVTFFTLGYGDMTAQTGIGRAVAVIAAGTGFGMLAMVISYIPVLYQAFSKRESTALLLDARAGSPPTAGELLRRYAGDETEGLEQLFETFEKWCANLLESFLSYPMLAMYRSQHEKLSWFACLTAILDATAFVQAAYEEADSGCRRLRRQAELTFAIARHLVVDLAFILNVEPMKGGADRLSAEEFSRFVAHLQADGTKVRDDAHARLSALRHKYEPYLNSLSREMILALPPWLPEPTSKDSWQTSAWDKDGHF